MKPSKDQMDKGLAFNGQGGEGYSRNSRLSKVQTNHHSGTMNEGKLVNKGRGPTRGNQDNPAAKVGPPATKDAFRRAPDRVGVSGTERPTVKNPDSQNYGKQERNPGGTREWNPSMTQNYKGNPDSIRIGQTGGPGYGEVSRGKQVNQSTPSTFNYGPNSQY
jgi:hypothetical protein